MRGLKRLTLKRILRIGQEVWNFQTYFNRVTVLHYTGKIAQRPQHRWINQLLHGNNTRMLMKYDTRSLYLWRQPQPFTSFSDKQISGLYPSWDATDCCSKWQLSNCNISPQRYHCHC